MAPTAQRRRGKDVDAVVNIMRERLRAGRYAPGYRLVESDLMNDLGATRAVVRESLRILAAEELVDIEPFRGASVRTLSRREIEDIYDVLEPLTVAISRLAAERIDQGDNRRRAKASLEATRRFRAENDHRRAFTDIVAESARFHEVMRELCGNPKLKKITEQLELQLVRILFRSIQEQNNVEQWTSHHDEILQAILAGDPAKAAELTSAYARENRQLIRSLPDWLFD